MASWEWRPSNPSVALSLWVVALTPHTYIDLQTPMADPADFRHLVRLMCLVNSTYPPCCAVAVIILTLFQLIRSFRSIKIGTSFLGWHLGRIGSTDKERIRLQSVLFVDVALSEMVEFYSAILSIGYKESSSRYWVGESNCRASQRNQKKKESPFF